MISLSESLSELMLGLKGPSSIDGFRVKSPGSKQRLAIKTIIRHPRAGINQKPASFFQILFLKTKMLKEVKESSIA